MTVEHLPGCTSKPIADLIDGSIDLEYERETWRDDIHVCICVPDCPVLGAAKERGRQLAERYGW